MASVSDTSAHEDRAESGPHYDSGHAIIGKLAHIGSVVHLANLIHSDAVDAPPKKRWQGSQLVHVSCSDEIELVSA